MLSATAKARWFRPSNFGLAQSIIAVVDGGAPMTGQIARRVIEAFRKPAAKEPEGAELTARGRKRSSNSSPAALQTRSWLRFLNRN